MCNRNDKVRLCGLVLKLGILLALVIPLNGVSQELEPRSRVNLPRNLNFFAAGYAYASGNVLLDASLPLDDFNGRINTIVLAYVRSVNFFGKSGRIDAVIPFAGGDYTGVFEGSGFEDSYTGFGDLRLRFSVNLTGAPSLKPEEFKSFTPKTITGLSLQFIIPTGNYIPEQLPNLGANRWSIRGIYGVSHKFKKWFIEGHTGFWIFTPNNEFLVDNKLTQSPLWVIKGDLTRAFNKQGMWLAFSMGYAYGGVNTINDVKRDVTISQLRLGLTYALPFGRKHTLKFVAGSGIRFQQGSDFDVVSVGYQYRWLDAKAKDQARSKN
ncbi:MAG: transporter [Flavobacteriaceae bacterium]|nr:MAG: transporter [Flavobacteriaceae bacterium]